jgi:hypothetical protein
MRKRLIAMPLLVAAAPVQPLQTGRWDVTSKVVEFVAPGVPGFVARMIRGKSRAEHKRLSSGEGLESLLLPDPKARCRVDSQMVRGGRYAQTLTCPQKNGGPLRIDRSGTFDASGFVGRATVIGTTPKGALRIVLDQRAARVGR